MRLVVALALLVGASQLAMPAHANAQILKKIRDQVEKKVEASKARADSAAVARAGRTVDSTLAKTGRVLDTAVSKTAGVADAVVSKTGEIVSSAAGALSGAEDEEKLVAELEKGRLVLAEVSFVEGTGELAESSEPHLQRLAKVLRDQSATFVIEGHVDDGGNAATNQALSEKRAAAVKARLVTAGVPAERLFAMGLGATRPPADPNASYARIEVARMK
ncbi:MAG TPA: OmpA family protein [Gemmatimonadaceae bacterium]|nr:OmpA family protein [Gemmatimonadaceae bacterium]